ncbi:MAG: hypothetical protein IJ289_06755, partial [Clostridia bacterium]|nr:hypothetical protein [Clostridia bacterium]
MEIFDFHYQINPNIEFIAIERCSTVIAPLHYAIGGLRATRPTKFVFILYEYSMKEHFIVHCAL